MIIKGADGTNWRATGAAANTGAALVRVSTVSKAAAKPAVKRATKATPKQKAAVKKAAAKAAKTAVETKALKAQAKALKAKNKELVARDRAARERGLLQQQRRDPITGGYPVDGKIEYQRPGPFLGDQKPFPPLSGERETEADWGVAR
jgi:hypothetical protein